ncbi:MAG: PEP-CTERM sorting domain-containing protein [Armatimonadetes bacterium]|nr:PEP-CTERM sorting domain-containing protein [Armatimonadota bacterium]
MVRTKVIALAALVAAVGAAHAVTFSNFVYTSSPLSDGASQSFGGNSISFFTPNAIVGDASTLRSGNLSIQYDADAGVSVVSVGVLVSLGAPVLGSGTVNFTEKVWELDCNTGQTLGLLGSISHSFDVNSGTVFSGNISLSSQVKCIRVLKSFDLNAPDTNDLDIAAVAVVNQSIQTAPVPEPATLAVLGLGGLIVSRRRRK